MAQITPAPTATLVPRQDLDSLLSAGLSFLSSVVSPQTTDGSTLDSSITSSSSTTISIRTRTTSTTAPTTTGSTSSRASSRSTSSSTFTIPTTTSSLSGLTPLSATSTPSTTSTASSSKHSTPILPIVLGVVFGLLLVVLVAVFILCCRRRRRNGAPLFKRKRSESPLASDGDLESLDEPMTEHPYAYPSVPPPYQLARQRQDNASYDTSPSSRTTKYGAAVHDSPFDDSYRSGYDRRRSMRSLSLGPVPEQAERERTESVSSIRRKPVPNHTRSFSAGAGYIRHNAPWIPPRSHPRPMSSFVSRKPIPGAQVDSGFDFGIGQQQGGRYGASRRHSSSEHSLPDAHHRF